MSAPASQVRRTAIFGRNQIFLCVFVAIVVVVWNASFYVLSRAEGGGQLYDYQGTSGPFAVTSDSTGYVAGEPISSVKRGGLLGWTTTLCIHKGIGGLGITELVKTSPGDEEIVNRIEVPIPPDTPRCGPRTVARLVPLDAPPGYYEVRRQILLTVNGHPHPPVDLPPLHVRVER